MPNGITPVPAISTADNPFLEPTPTIDALTKLRGSLVIDGMSSYSGADIKVVVHIYDQGAENQRQIRKLTEELTFQKHNLDTLISLGAAADPSSMADLDSIQGTINYLEDEIIRLQIVAPGFSTKVLAELQTLSVSTHREKYPVRGLGAVYPKCYTRGPRTIAGSMIFTVFDKNVLYELLQAHPSDFDAHVGATSALLDQLPPFDITVAFANELGQVSRMTIYAAEFVNEGQTMSIEDILLENVVQYVARDLDPMRPIGNRKIDENQLLTKELIPTRASDLGKTQEYKDFKNQLSPFGRFATRHDPFI